MSIYSLFTLLLCMQVGNAFVDQYYHILHQSPELVDRFYQDSSMLSRPELNGVMTSVTTMQVSLFGWSHAACCQILFTNTIKGIHHKIMKIVEITFQG